MEPPNGSIEKADRARPELDHGTPQRPTVLFGYAEPVPATYAAPRCESFLDYWRMLLRHKAVLLRFVLGGLAAAVLFSLLQPPRYRARTSLEIRDFNENFLDLRSMDPAHPAGRYALEESYFETQIKILHSESLLERVIDKLKLHASPANSSPDTGKVDPEKQKMIQKAGRNLTVRAAPNTRLLEVLYAAPDPQQAADFANTLVAEFIEQSQELRWKSTRRAAEWLTSHLDEMKSKLEKSEAQLQDYARTSGLTFATSWSGKDNLGEIRLRELQDELSRAHADRVAKEARYVEAKNKELGKLPEVFDDSTLREHRLKLADLQRELVELSATLTPQHYKVKRVQAQIAELESAVRQESSLIRNRVRNEYTTALRREKFLADAYAAQQKIVADQSSKAIHYDTLKREVDSTRLLHEAMLQRVKQAEMASAMRASNVLVVDAAKPPLLPYRPNLPLTLSIGLFGGVFLGFGFILFRERFDHRIQAPGEMRTYASLPELGVIPLATAPVTRRIGNGTRASARQRVPSAMRPLEFPLGDCPELVTWNRKPSLLAESFRATLTSILLPGEDGARPRVVVLTSPIPGDGKTTVASNLSIAMAETGRKVLLVDGDLHRPRVHKVLAVSNRRGLSDILSSSIPLEDGVPVSEMVCETKISGLYLLPGGRGTVTASSLFYSSRMSELLGRLRAEFDMVLVDAPPMIHLADARVLGRLADGVILVVRAGRTPLHSALYACQRFAEDGTRVLGTILNSWDPSTGDMYAYQEYLEKYGA
jgi:capsular exopolysaccharide synthesis family protein